MIKKRYPNYLRKYRRARGWGQQDVAGILGLRSASIISRWEKSRTLPNTINIFKLSAVYGVLAEELFSPLITAIWQDKIKRQKMIYRRENKRDVPSPRLYISLKYLKLKVAPSVTAGYN